MCNLVELDIVLALLAMGNVGALIYFATTMLIAIIALWSTRHEILPTRNVDQPHGKRRVRV